MREGWDLVKLGSLCDIQNGFAFDSKLFNSDGKGLPLIRIRDIKRGYSETFTTEECDNAYVVKDGDYLIGMDGEFNIGQWKSENALLNQRVCKLLPSNKILPRFIYYYIPKALKDIEDKTAYATVKHLSSKQIKEIHIPNISLPEQQRIVDILDQEFAKIDALKANAEKSLQAAKDLFQATLKKELKPKEGWIVKRMGEICSLSQGLAINAHTKHLIVPSSSLPLLRIKDLKDGTREIFINENDCPKSCIAYPNDLIYTRTGTLGLIFTGFYGVMHNNCFKITLDNSQIDKHFYMYYVQESTFKENILALAKRAAQPDITHKIFKEQLVSFPPLEEQLVIAAQLKDSNDKCNTLQENYQKTLSLCDDLKQSLLRKAFSGEL